jgi:hypothetical protein
MTDFIVTATLTVKANALDRPKIKEAHDRGLKELPGLASRYGFEIVDSEVDVTKVD